MTLAVKAARTAKIILGACMLNESEASLVIYRRGSKALLYVAPTPVATALASRHFGSRSCDADLGSRQARVELPRVGERPSLYIRLLIAMHFFGLVMDRTGQRARRTSSAGLHYKVSAAIAPPDAAMGAGHPPMRELVHST